MDTKFKTPKPLAAMIMGVFIFSNILFNPKIQGVGLAQAGKQPSSRRSTVFLPLVHRNTSGGVSRGYLTTPAELARIKQKASQKIEPYYTAYHAVMSWANQDWNYPLESTVTCPDSDNPAWLDNDSGIPILYGKALAYRLTGNSEYAASVKSILERIMSEVKNIDTDHACRLRFAWGTPELVASADLIESYWSSMTCLGPTRTLNSDMSIGIGNCKDLFQNWLVKNPYYIVSYSAAQSNSNWGAAATTTTAYIADYLWDRPEVKLVHRHPEEINGGRNIAQTPAQAYAYSKQLMLDRMNGFRVTYGSSDACDLMIPPQQNSQWAPVKSQITENGIITEDARREENCNIPKHDGLYHNYPQIHAGNNIQQCELYLRRGDRSCFDNIDNRDLPNYTFTDPRGIIHTTHLYPGRGSLERVIKAIIVDSNTEWCHDPALVVAYRYYYNNHRLDGFEQWRPQLGGWGDCGQDVCFAGLTHGFADNETPNLPPTTAPPQ